MLVGQFSTDPLKVKAGERPCLVQWLLMDCWRALGRGLEGMHRSNRLSLFVDHADVVGGVGLQVSERCAVIVAAGLLNGIRRQWAKVVGIGTPLQDQVLTCF